jgi:glucose/arabinose dehydrogenase
VQSTARAAAVVTGLASPWGAAALPDGRLLVTQRTTGSFVLVDPAAGRVVATIGTGLPVGGTGGQGGMLGVAIDPAFATTQRIFWSFTEEVSAGVGVAVARARLVGTTLQDVQVIWRLAQPQWTNRHFGSRLAVRADATLFVTIGDLGQDNPDAPTRRHAQSTASALGKVIRLTPDGAPAPGNPNLGSEALPEVWSLGHRNPQGAAIHPLTGELWVSEHGALGGDEINIARAGANFGWPFVSYGCNYGTSGGDSCRIGGGVHGPTYAEPVTTWIPQSIAPSGIAFDRVGTRYPGWAGSLFVGAMAGIPNGGQALWRLTLSGNSVTGREYLLKSLNERIRDVVQTPDGWIYLLTDSGRILRLLPS